MRPGSANEGGEFAGRVVLVVGWGASGQAAAQVLHERGARVWATDLSLPEELTHRWGPFPPWLDQGFWGGHPPGLAKEAELLVVSPGVPPTIPLFAEARDAGRPVWGEVELAARLGRAPILGVTGTNGKSTVVTMLGECFHAAGRKVVVAGNVGVPLISVYPGLESEATAVVELSSYQLETIDRFTVRGAVILNIRPDHLQRHREFSLYREAKARLLACLEEGGFAVLFRDDPAVASLAERVKERILEVSLREPVPAGGYVDERGNLILRGTDAAGILMRRNELPLPGEHNVINALCAAVAASACGVSAEAVSRALSSARSLPHRLERVGFVGGVLLINDSKATNVDSTLAALRSVAPPLVLIAGGIDKGLPFRELGPELSLRARGLVLTGESRERMSRELGGLCPIRLAEDLAAALEEALELAAGEGTILFSPAASSFDQFRDFSERGEAFRRASRALAGFRPDNSEKELIRDV